MQEIKKDILHKSFEVGLLIKGIDGLLEILGGFLLLFVNQIRLNKLVSILTQHELLEDKRDVVANYIINLSQSFSISTQHFGAFYLAAHGFIKIIIVTLLLKKSPIAYPIAIISLIAFISYQIYRFTITGSTLLLILSVFDCLMIILTVVEYVRIKSEKKIQAINLSNI